MLKGTYTCPLCKKSTLGDEMTAHINTVIQGHIDNTQMGELGEKDVKIICNE